MFARAYTIVRAVVQKYMTMQSSKTRSWSPLLRVGAILAFVGVVTYGISWPIHPGVPDASDWAASAEAYAQSDDWVTIHLAQLFGLLSIFLGIAILAEGLRREYRGTIIDALAFLALVTTILTASVFTILQMVDGISLKAMVDRWANASGDEKEVAFRVSESIRWIEIGLNSPFRFLQAISAILIGAAIALTYNRENPYPKARILGGVAIAIGIGMALRGYAISYMGFSEQNPLYSGTHLFILFLLLWMVAIGIAMWRRRSPALLAQVKDKRD